MNVWEVQEMLEDQSGLKGELFRAGYRKCTKPQLVRADYWGPLNYYEEFWFDSA